MIFHLKYLVLAQCLEERDLKREGTDSLIKLIFEILGSNDFVADLELITLANDILKTLIPSKNVILISIHLVSQNLINTKKN